MGTTKSICFIAPYIGPFFADAGTSGTGGAERQFYLFGVELQKRGWEVSFIGDCPRQQGRLANGLIVHSVRFRHMGGGLRHLLPEGWQFLRALRRANASYVVIKTAPHLIALVLLHRVLFRRGNLVIWGQMSTSFDRLIRGEPAWLSRIRALGIRCASHRIAQTEEQAEHLRRDFGLSSTVIPNITVTPPPAPPPCGEQDYVFWCGNSRAGKRQEVFLELARNCPSRRFVMAMNAGDSNRFEEARRVASTIPNLRFLGSVPSREIDGWFAHAAVYIHTSVLEGFPNTYLQAFQQGCPVLTINIDPDGILEKHGLGHCLYSNDEHLTKAPVELAGEIRPFVEALLEQPDLRIRYREACRNYVQSRHTPEATVPLLERLLAG
jgi:glycosyltransferase involved in cell wall biosynthesis